MLKDGVVDFDLEDFENDGPILPAQMRPTVNALYARSGERLLMLAVLTDAVNIFLKKGAERRILSETRDWIRGGSSGGYAISFDNACEALGMDPAALRQRLFLLKYGTCNEPVLRRRSSLAVKPPASSRGPVKIAPALRPATPVRTKR
jgi:hypothetical protein